MLHAGITRAGDGMVTAVRARTTDLRRLLERQAERATVPRELREVVELDAGPEGGRWTITLQDGSMSVEPGTPESPSARIITDAGTVAAIVRGQKPGVQAFLHGDLRVRGNLALALRMDSMLRSHEGHIRWPRFESIRAGGLHTAYLEAGDGPPVVLLHGLGATNTSMLPTIWDLARDHRVIAPDLPGFGESGKPVRSYHAGFFSRWLTDLLRKLGAEGAHLVGNSMGGRVAIEAGLREPELIDRLVLLAPAPAFIKGREYVRIVRLLRPELALIPIPLQHRFVVRSIRGMFSQPNRLPRAWYDAAADEFLRVFQTGRGRIAFFSAARQIYLEEPHGSKGFWDRLPALERPALFVWGERDRLVPAKFARHVENALPAATSVILPDCGHVPQYEHPKRTNKLIRDFIDAPG